MSRRAGEYFDDELLTACDLVLQHSTAPIVRDVLREYIASRFAEWDEELEARAWRDRCRAREVNGERDLAVGLEPMRYAA